MDWKYLEGEKIADMRIFMRNYNTYLKKKQRPPRG